MGRGLGSYIRKSDEIFILSITRCMYCGIGNKLHIDHIHPLNKGGNSEISNLTRACNKCNGLKSDFMMPVFLNRIVDKRSKTQEIFRKYANRYAICRKRGFSNYDLKYILDCVDKIRKARNDHNYYTRIIHSIINLKYLPMVIN